MMRSNDVTAWTAALRNLDGQATPARLETVFEAFVQALDVAAGDVAAARAAYELRRGKVYQDSPLWEAWSAAFVEWLVLESPTRQAATATLHGLIHDESGRDVLARYVHAWVHSHRSVFEVEAMRPGCIVLIDLIGGARFEVHEARQLAGVECGDVAEFRLLACDDKVWLGRTLIYHPRGIRDAVMAQIARMAPRLPRGAILDELAKRRTLVPLYKHVPPARVYAMEG